MGDLHHLDDWVLVSKNEVMMTENPFEIHRQLHLVKMTGHAQPMIVTCSEKTFEGAAVGDKVKVYYEIEPQWRVEKEKLS